MIRKLRRALAELRQQKFKDFADFERIINKIRREYGALFPQFRENRDGSRYVYHFNVPGVNPISLEKPHGSRDSIPPKFASRAIQGIEDVLTFIEESSPDDERTDPEEAANESPANAQEAAGTVPEPEIPDGDSGG